MESRFEVDPAYPASGDWGIPTWTIGVNGPRRGHPSVGQRRVVRFDAGSGAWVGFFEDDYWDRCDVSRLGEGRLFVWAGGAGVVVDPEDPEGSRWIEYPYPICGVREFQGDVILWSFDRLARVGADGRKWVSEAVCMGDLEVLRVEGNRIGCRGDLLPMSEFVVSAVDGDIISGPAPQTPRTARDEPDVRGPHRGNTSQGKRMRRIVAAAVGLLVAYLLFAVVSTALVSEDACATRTGWDNEEGNGLLTDGVSFLPPGKSCRWTDVNGVRHEVVLTAW